MSASAALAPAMATDPAQPLASAGDASSDLPSGTGVYRGARYRDPYCCWLAADAVFHVSVPASATKLTVIVIAPSVAAVRHGDASIAILINGRHAGDFRALRVGANALTIPLPADGAGRTATVELKPGFFFVPKNEHLNGDTRKLSVILRELKAE